MTEIYAGFIADHTFDHLRLRTTRILCREEHTKAVNPGAKAPKSPQNHAKNQDFSVWDQDAAGSSPVTSTISSVLNQPESWIRTLDFFLPFYASLYV